MYFVRRIVSGNKTRFRDNQLDLDLAYLTDQVIVTGFPASGIEGLYRNRREDTKKFFDSRHNEDYWVFNFCPVTENSYPAAVFEGRVSRYPFPDHNVPPLAILPLVTREISLWLIGSPDRVVVLHCKAGKGRSGTMACSFLMSLDDTPTPPLRERSYTAKEWAKVCAEKWMQVIPPDDQQMGLSTDENNSLDEGETQAAITESQQTSSSIASNTEASPEKPSKSASDILNHVLDLHTTRRMKQPSSESAKIQRGVSIPSQRRWLHYWSLLLTQQVPPGFWTTSSEQSPKIRITSIKIRMKDLSPIKYHLVKAANILLDHANAAKTSHGQVWISLAKYDDKFVSLLEKWEQHTRSEDDRMGKQKSGSYHMDGQSLADFFNNGQWDKSKMVRSFTRLGITCDDSVVESEDEALGKISTYSLQALSQDKWNKLQMIISEEKQRPEDAEIQSEAASMDDLTTQTLPTELEGIVLDANREVRVKLYIGQVWMGWFWFIPTFHILPDERMATLNLSRKEIDFSIGLGTDLIDVVVYMERC